MTQTPSPIFDHPLVTKAATFALAAHAEQQRKYTGDPYFVHLAEVAELVAKITDDPETVAVAFLHDTLEDTAVTYPELVEHFGVNVAQGVLALSDQSTKDDGNRAARKRQDRYHLHRSTVAHPGLQNVKTADTISNSYSIARHDPGFAKTYMPEMRDRMTYSLFDAHPALRQVAVNQINNYFEDQAKA